jgi:hypothetical protein
MSRLTRVLNGAAKPPTPIHPRELYPWLSVIDPESKKVYKFKVL